MAANLGIVEGGAGRQRLAGITAEKDLLVVAETLRRCGRTTSKIDTRKTVLPDADRTDEGKGKGKQSKQVNKVDKPATKPEDRTGVDEGEGGPSGTGYEERREEWGNDICEEAAGSWVYVTEIKARPARPFTRTVVMVLWKKDRREMWSAKLREELCKRQLTEVDRALYQNQTWWRRIATGRGGIWLAQHAVIKSRPQKAWDKVHCSKPLKSGHANLVVFLLRLNILCTRNQKKPSLLYTCPGWQMRRDIEADMLEEGTKSRWIDRQRATAVKKASRASASGGTVSLNMARVCKVDQSCRAGALFAGHQVSVQGNQEVAYIELRYKCEDVRRLLGENKRYFERVLARMAPRTFHASITRPVDTKVKALDLKRVAAILERESHRGVPSGSKLRDRTTVDPTACPDGMRALSKDCGANTEVRRGSRESKRLHCTGPSENPKSSQAQEFRVAAVSAQCGRRGMESRCGPRRGN
ncbi:hypothetical protein B0H14DRAFT_2586433 [Mycena olivaceomarginata]|nr:hypothetical protein B0H14DRAFT_2586433 [Mycena olivaceomarginata]